MADSQSKREIPSGLKSVLEADIKLSKDFVEYVNKNYPVATYRSHLKSLEVSEKTKLYKCDMQADFFLLDFLSWNPLAIYQYCWSLLIHQSLLLQPSPHPAHNDSLDHTNDNSSNNIKNMMSAKENPADTHGPSPC